MIEKQHCDINSLTATFGCFISTDIRINTVARHTSEYFSLYSNLPGLQYQNSFDIYQFTFSLSECSFAGLESSSLIADLTVASDTQSIKCMKLSASNIHEVTFIFMQCMSTLQAFVIIKHKPMRLNHIHILSRTAVTKLFNTAIKS